MKRVFAALGLGILAGCSPVVTSATFSDGGGSLISIHLATDREQAGLKPVRFEGQVIFMESDPILGDGEIAAVHSGRSAQGVVLDVHFTAEGAEELRKVTAENVGNRLVLMFGSKVVGVPVIRSRLEGPRVQMPIPAASADEAEVIVERVRARWPVQGREGGRPPKGRKLGLSNSNLFVAAHLW